MVWNHVFTEYGEDGVPTWNLFGVSHAIAFHANLVLSSSHMFFYFFKHSSRVGGAKCETSLVCEKNFELCRVHWEGVKGPHILIFFRIPVARELSYSRGVIVLYGLTFYILGYFGCFWFNPGAMSKLCWQKWFFGGRNMCCRQCMCQKKTAFG